MRASVRRPRRSRTGNWTDDRLSPTGRFQLSQTEDDLFTPYERRRGLPIGDLTNQLFSKFARPASARWPGAEARGDAHAGGGRSRAPRRRISDPAAICLARRRLASGVGPPPQVL